MLALDGSRISSISMASRIGQPKYLVAKSVLYEAGDWGKVWRVVSGGLRLDNVLHQQNRFASLALVSCARVRIAAPAVVSMTICRSDSGAPLSLRIFRT